MAVKIKTPREITSKGRNLKGRSTRMGERQVKEKWTARYVLRNQELLR